MTDGADIKARMNLYLAHKKFKPSWVEKHAMLGNGYLRNTAGGYTATKLCDLLRVCSDLNLNWLITGVGEMLLTTDGKVSAQVTHFAGDQIHQEQSDGGGPQYGKVGTVVSSETTESFFCRHNSVELVTELDINEAPEMAKPLVRSIQSHTKDLENLERKFAELEKRYLEISDDNKDLQKKLYEAKNETIETMNRLYQAVSKTVECRSEK